MLAHKHDLEPKSGSVLTSIKHYDVYVGMTDKKGAGLFSNVLIPKHVIIVESVARRIQICAEDLDPVVSQYLFVDPDRYKESRRLHDAILVCSELTLLNHSTKPNSYLVWEEVSTDLLQARLVSAREILVSEEITIFYTDAENYQGPRSLS